MNLVERASQTLARIEESLFAMWDALPELFIAVDEEGKIRRISAACEMTLGWTKAEMQGQHWFLFTHPDDLSRTAAVYDEHRGSGHPIVGLPACWRTKDGEYVQLYWYTPSTTMGGVSFSVATLKIPGTPDSKPILYTVK